MDLSARAVRSVKGHWESMGRLTAIYQLLSMLGFSPPCSVLDLGCGSGQVSVTLAEKGYVVTGVDNDLFQITEAARRAQGQGMSVYFVHCDGLAISKSELGCYDIVLMKDYIHMLPERLWVKQLRLAAELLKPNGCVLLIDGASSRVIPAAEAAGLQCIWKYGSIAVFK